LVWNITQSIGFITYMYITHSAHRKIGLGVIHD